MPFAIAIWAAIKTFIFITAVPLIVHLMKIFGIGILVFTGADFVIDEAEAFVFDNYDNLPANLYALLSMAGFSSGIKILFSAYAANIAIKTISGNFKRFGFTG